MKLDLAEDQRLISDTFERFFRGEVDTKRVRNAGDLGFDAGLWRNLSDMGALSMRAPNENGVRDQSLLDALLVMEHAGAHLAPVPLVEGMVTRALLGALDSPVATAWRKRFDSEPIVLAFAVEPIALESSQIVPAAAVAKAVIGWCDDHLVLFELEHVETFANMGALPLGRIDFSNEKKQVLATGPHARALFDAAREEWKLLNAAWIVGAARRGLEIAARYASEREAFGRPIGTYQGVAHPLADAFTELDGAQLLVRYAAAGISTENTRAAALCSMATWWAAAAGARALTRCVHVHGGYGLALEYDIQLYYRKVRTLALQLGDPAQTLEAIGRRLWLKERPTALPDGGEAKLDFEFGPEAEAFAAQTRQLLASLLTPAHQARAHFSFEGHDWDVHRAVGATGRLHPSWPAKHGGLGADLLSVSLSDRVWDEFRWSRLAVIVTDMVGHLIIQFGQESLKDEVLPRLARGEATCSLGFSEPSGGSDVFAARTRAQPIGDEWLINGQKMWTSGAELADYIFLLARTDPNSSKHKGLTLFLVPTSTPGVDIHPIHTFMDERTNATYYADVRLPDRYRIGEVNNGVAVMSAALRFEQGGGTWVLPHAQLVQLAVEWATRHGVLESPGVLQRLATAATHSVLSDLIYRRSVWATLHGRTDQAYGPMSKLFSSEYYLKDSSDLLDLTAPDSLGLSNDAASQINRDHRRAHAATVYGGTSEVHRSMIAERMLGLPRSRGS
jgi:3-oxochol-4-en-24-oyl-CoA dehydrogenase